MDWLKRNWVDALMGALILAIAAGVFVVLLRGGLFVSRNPSADTTTPAVSAPAPTIAMPTNPPSTDPPSPTPPTAVPQNQDPVSNASASNTPAPAKPAVTPRATVSLAVPEIPEAPKSQPPAAKSPSATASSAKSPSATSSSAITLPANTKPAISAKPTATQAITPPKPSTQTTNGSYSRADFLRNYRIAAGSYTNLERAVRAAGQLRTRGLPAQHFSSGNTYIVVVGPYSREASARSALARVRQSSPDAILYRPDGSKEVVAAKPVIKPATKPSSGGGGSSPATLTAASYLQVGAFKDSNSANALGTKLRIAGFKPLTKNISGLLRVLVGPFSASQIQTTRASLKDQGFDAFPINL